MSDAAETPGSRLRCAREAKGLSVQKAADALRLDAWAVEALEGDRFERIGAPVYAKGHLRRYAALLGLAPQEIIAAYELQVAAPPAAASPLAPPPAQSQVPRTARIPWAEVSAAAAFVLITLVLWWSPWQRRGAPGESARPAAVPAETLAMPPGTPASRPSGSDVSRVLASAAPTAGAGRARLKMSFSADSWVDVRDANGRPVFVGHGRANSVKSLAGAAPLSVFLGYASGVQLEINERAVAIAPPFVKGDVARFRAGADGVLRVYAGEPRPRG